MNEGGKKRGGARGAGRILKELLDILPRLDEEGARFPPRTGSRAPVQHGSGKARPGSGERLGGSGFCPGKALGHAPRALGRWPDLPRRRRGEGKMFSAEEIAALVRITRSGEEGGEVARRVYAWLDRERGDALERCRNRQAAVSRPRRARADAARFVSGAPLDPVKTFVDYFIPREGIPITRSSLGRKSMQPGNYFLYRRCGCPQMAGFYNHVLAQGIGR